MREIIFRGKRVDNGEWVQGFYLSSPEFDNKGIAVITVDKPRTPCYVYKETIGQYTGLTANGKKIFEGDIVKCRHSWRLQVYPNDGIDGEKYFFEQKIRGAYGKYKHESPCSWWSDEYFYFRNYAVEYYAPNGGFRVRNGGQFHALTSSYISNRNLEVIGNIHDNPELLKGESNEAD